MSDRTHQNTKSRGGNKTLPPPTPEPLRTEVVPAPPPAELTLTGGPVNQAARAFLDDAGPDRQPMTRIGMITIDHGEGTFKLPTGDTAEEVSGYPIFVFQTRRAYLESYRPGTQGTPPDCWSADLVTPHSSSLKVQAETCAECPLSQFGSSRAGRGQACATYTWVFLLNPNFGNPPVAVLVAPPSSIKTLLGTRFQSGYFSQATAKHGCYEIVWSTFRLERIDPHSIVHPTMGEAIEDMAKARQLSALRKQLLNVMNAFRMRTVDLPEGEVPTTANEGA